MVAANETVFTVLADAARRESSRRLGWQLVLSGGAAAAIALAAPQWWSVAFLVGCSATWSAWGLLDRVAGARQGQIRSLNALSVTLASAGTVLALAGVIGIGLAMYTGNARGIKNACGAGSTNELCQALAAPAPAGSPIK